MDDDHTSLRNRQQHDDGYRTPSIEDANHPLNIWRSRENRRGTIDAYFRPRDQNTREQLDRFRKLDSLSEHQSEESHRKNTSRDVHLPWTERIKHTTWAYFTMCMATGGLANVLHSVPYRSDWIYYVGLIVFFLNLVLYLIIWSMLLTRFLSYPSTFRASLVHPTESLFVPGFVVSLGTICITIVEYGANNTGQWLTKAVLVLFWINVFLAMTLSITIYMVLWSSLTFTIAQMTPIWIFPAYPLLIIGPHAANLSAKLYDPTQALQVIVGGFTVQGVGFLVSLTIYSAFVYRLMTQKLPADPSRPAMFVSVGPAAFTCSGTIGMAENLHRALVHSDDPSTQMFMGVPADLASNILRIVANWCSLWLWGLAIWFFFVSVIGNVAPLYMHHRQKVHFDAKSDNKRRHGHKKHRQTIPFAMTWYSYIFPQTAMTTATFRVAEAFNIEALNILGCVMTGLLIILWFFVVTMMIRAVMLKHILWPEKGEDREEGGFMRPRTAQKGVKGQDDVEAQAARGSSNNAERNGEHARHWPADRRP